MSCWSDPEAWARLRLGEGCVLCEAAGGPRDVLAELEVSRATMGAPTCLPGASCLVLRRHVVELHELEDAEAAAFMRDVRRLGRAVQAATGAVKLNYEVHGNTLPHLHLHLFPRYPGDPFEGRPIDPRRVQPYAPGELERLRARVLAELRRGD